MRRHQAPALAPISYDVASKLCQALPTPPAPFRPAMAAAAPGP